jgi:hypothetical protein
MLIACRNGTLMILEINKDTVDTKLEKYFLLEFTSICGLDILQHAPSISCETLLNRESR